MCCTLNDSHSQIWCSEFSGRVLGSKIVLLSADRGVFDVLQSTAAACHRLKSTDGYDAGTKWNPSFARSLSIQRGKKWYQLAGHLCSHQWQGLFCVFTFSNLALLEKSLDTPVEHILIQILKNKRALFICRLL